MTDKAKLKIDAKVRSFSKLYAQMKLNGNIDYNKLVRMWNIKEQQPEWKCRRLLKNKVISDMVTEEILSLYNKQGITADFVIEQEKRILESAKSSDNLRIQLDVVNNWRDSLDLKPIKQQQITTTQTDYIKLIDKDTGKQITAKQTKQLKQADLTDNNTSPAQQTDTED